MNDKKGSNPRTLKELRELNAHKQLLAKEHERELIRAKEEITFGELFDTYTKAGIIRKKYQIHQRRVREI